MDELTHRRKDRGRRARRTGIWGIIYQGVYATVQLAGLGILLRYVGKEQYGLWMTVLALTSWVPLAALGQPAALLTKLGAVAHTQPQEAQHIFSASAALVTSVAIALIFVLLLAGQLLPWSRLLNATDTQNVAMAGITAMAALTVSLASLPGILAGYAIFAHQRGDLVHIIMSAGSFVGLFMTVAAIWLGQSLWFVGALTLSGPLLGGLALSAYGLATDLVPRPRWALLDRIILRDLIRAGLLFVVIDITAMTFLRGPDLIVAQLYGADAVGPFASVGRLPLLVLALFQALLLPFWPALGEAAHRGDHEWIRRIAARTLGLTLGLWVLGAAGIWSFGVPLMLLWMGSAEFANPDLIAAACIQSLGLGLFTWLSIVLAALSLQRVLIVSSGIASLLFLPLAYLLGKWLGPVGVALAQAVALLSCAVPIGAIGLHLKLGHGNARSLVR